MIQEAAVAASSSSEIIISSPNGKAEVENASPLHQRAAPELHILPLSALYESPNNPRKRFDPAAMQELTASVKAQGVRVPLTVRHNPKTGAAYEIIAGHRRFRAASAASLLEVPVLVHVLSDREALEIMTIDNLQREDVHPLEEADGFQAMLDFQTEGAPVHTVESLAKTLGKSIGYIYQRLKYRDLVPQAREAFANAEVSAGHAILIARLPRPVDQKQALEWSVEGEYSVHGLAEAINSQIYHKIKSAPFPVEKADLTLAGSCMVCPSRTGSNPELHSGTKDDSCTNPSCWETKCKAFVVLKVTQLENKKAEPVVKLTEEYVYDDKKQKALAKQGVISKAEYQRYTTIEAKAPACPHTKVGVFQDGPNVGSARRMCTIRTRSARFTILAAPRRPESHPQNSRSEEPNSLRSAIKRKSGS